MKSFLKNAFKITAVIFQNQELKEKVVVVYRLILLGEIYRVETNVYTKAWELHQQENSNVRFLILLLVCVGKRISSKI